MNEHLLWESSPLAVVGILTEKIWRQCYISQCCDVSLTFPVSLLTRRFNKIQQVSFSLVCPVIDHEFRHNIVKVAVDQRGDNRVDPQTTFYHA